MPVTVTETETEITALYREVDALLADIRRQGAQRAAAWSGSPIRAEFTESALNLAHYLSLRHADLRQLQRSLMLHGLSSLGRLESRVVPGLESVRSALAAVAGLTPVQGPSGAEFFAGERRIAERKREIFGTSRKMRQVALLVTCPTESAEDPSFMRRVAEQGVEAVRINCAHDDPACWQRMIDNVRAAERATGQRLKVLMDLAGPKIRTGAVRMPAGLKRIGRDATFAVVPPGGLDHGGAVDSLVAVECTLPEALRTVKAGDRLFVDDGKLGAEVEQAADWGLVVRVTTAPDKGVRLKPEKGLNFPDSQLGIPAVTDHDLAALDFVAAHADGVELSFVQTVDDVKQLQSALAARRPADWRELSLILKIETPQAVRNLPDMIVQAAGQQPTAVMIARGDLAVEIGFARLAEMQEEILWIGEAAQVPVIWATQVLEHLIKKGTPSRGEMTDAAMAARAECVMLNKGPYLFEALAELESLLDRMAQNQHKKTPQLRQLRSW